METNQGRKSGRVEEMPHPGQDNSFIITNLLFLSHHIFVVGFNTLSFGKLRIHPVVSFETSKETKNVYCKSIL
ncbi:hypothetical protein [Saccharicrinis sp. FJH54]|uniref:hypothetical protein n=1 Tax=Saccharicrinis sp. FJH54 TaxID=3344665 RepID=UPI0035D503CC